MEKTYTNKELDRAISLSSGLSFGTGMILSGALLLIMKTEDKKSMFQALTVGGVGSIVIALIFKKIDSK